MPLEIERKFLVINDSWRNRAPGARFSQGYLTNTGVTVRVRRAGSRAYLTVKGPQRGICRSEFEYAIPVDEAEEMLRSSTTPTSRLRARTGSARSLPRSLLQKLGARRRAQGLA